MPTYQYVCNDCDHAFEQVQKFSEDSLTVCPRCEGRLRKIFNAVGVVFKGSGFYRTDNRVEAKTSAGKNGSSESAGDAPSTSSGDSSGDSSGKKDKSSTDKSPSGANSTSSSDKSSRESSSRSSRESSGNSSRESSGTSKSSPKAEAGAA